MNTTAKAFRGKDLQFLAVISHHDEEMMAAMMAGLEPTIRLYSDPQGVAADRLGIREFPYVLVFERDGSIRYRGRYPGGEALGRFLRDMLAGT